MLEIEIQNGNTNHFEDDLDSPAKEDLVKCFMRVVSPKSYQTGFAF